jgi:hypothetical protein
MRASQLLCLALPLVPSIALAQAPVVVPPATVPVVPPVAPVPPPPPTPPIPLPYNEPPVDYPEATWIPAAEGNFDPGIRPEVEKIDMVIIHDIEGPATAGVSIFQRKGANVSSHYIVDGEGKVFQMVREKNVGWHAGNRVVNHRSIGIETEGYAYRPGWFTLKTYEGEARLVRNITQRYAIPRDRTHIIGHFEVPSLKDPTKFGGSNGHTDPGPYWDWSTFMTLVRSDSRVETADLPTVIHPGEKLPVSVTLQNTGDDPWIANKAKDPRTGVQATAPLLFLGTAQGTPSAFSSLSGWMSAQYADVLKTTDVAPGSSARFDFTLQGPRTLGEVNEELRATYVPTIAQGGAPIPFGASVPLKMSVLPWDITVPAPDMPVMATSADAATPAPIAPTPAPVASWTIKLPIGGIWGVFVAPPKPDKVRKKEGFAYTVGASAGETAVAVDAKNGGKGLLFGGYFSFPEPTTKSPTVTVTLDKAPKGITAANAGSLRFVGPYPTLPTNMPVVPGAAG